MKKKRQKRLIWETDFKPVPRSRIEAVAAKWNVRFPEAYITCAQKYHGGFPNLECFDVAGREECVLANLLSYGDELDIEEFNADIRDRLPENVFSFAEDPFGNAVCFDYRDERLDEPRIVFWNHEVDLGSPKSILHVADSFVDFLAKLYIPH